MSDLFTDRPQGEDEEGEVETTLTENDQTFSDLLSSTTIAD